MSEKWSSQESVNVDLKWSLWSAEESTWEEQAPITLKAMKLYPEQLVIHTAPHKEIRFGSVSMECDSNQDGLLTITASGSFWVEWDETPSLLDTLKLPDEAQADLEDFMAISGYPTVRDILTVSHTFEDFLAAVDNEEEILIADDAKAWTATEKWAEAWLEEHKKG